MCDLNHAHTDTCSGDDFDAILSTSTPDAHIAIAEGKQLHFMLAGRAVFTVVSPKTGARYTYKVTRKEVDERLMPGGKTSLYFVKVLTGPDNTQDYTFAGTLFNGGTVYRHSYKSSIGATSPSVVAFQWLLARLVGGKDLRGVEVFHEGRCGRCGRALTVPTSIESGFGPECAGRI